MKSFTEKINKLIEEKTRGINSEIGGDLDKMALSGFYEDLIEQIKETYNEGLKENRICPECLSVMEVFKKNFGGQIHYYARCNGCGGDYE